MTYTDQDLKDVFDAERDETLRAEVVQSFRGKQRWMVLLVWVQTLVFFLVSVWAAVQFFGTDETRDQILFATLFLWSSLAVALMKMWYWSRLDRNALQRDIRRLELQVAKNGE